MLIKRYLPTVLACLVFVPTGANAQVFSQLAQRFHNWRGGNGDLRITDGAFANPTMYQQPFQT